MSAALPMVPAPVCDQLLSAWTIRLFKHPTCTEVLLDVSCKAQTQLLTALPGIVLLRGLPNSRRWLYVFLAVVLAAGGVTLGFFPGSGETADGGTDYHSLGAFAALLSGNVLLILLGSVYRSLGFSRRLGIGLKVAGVYGLLSIPAYMAVLASETGMLIGLVERGIVDPFLIGFLVVGAALRRT
ncbi:hypothetical protein [Streptomyces sp. NPDC020747]|uniref:hypothetical protein n=1 Tax=Streptomyces sp. NPDC020747 TaxID=3365086 RepID=UPI0037A344AE